MQPAGEHLPRGGGVEALGGAAAADHPADDVCLHVIQRGPRARGGGVDLFGAAADLQAEGHQAGREEEEAEAEALIQRNLSILSQ